MANQPFGNYAGDAALRDAEPLQASFVAAMATAGEAAQGNPQLLFRD